jgi:uncharacterized protein (DUF697 family)
MTTSTTTTSESFEAQVLRDREQEMAKLRDAAKNIGVDKLRDGSWFRRIVADHVKKHAQTINSSYWLKMYPNLDVEERAHKQIVSVAARASAAGALASLGASTGELLSLFTEGLGAPVGVPAAALSMMLEAGYTALLQIDLACDLASIYGVPFDAEDVGEVATLFGLALGVDIKQKKEEEGDEKEQPHGMMAKLIQLEDGEIATRIGRKLLEDAVIRNVVPIVGIAISARWNFVATKRLGATVKKYVRYRRALEQSVHKLKLTTVTDPGTLVEGAWLLATVDGEAEHAEVLAIALLMDKLPEGARKVIELDKTLGDDEDEWFEALRRVPSEMHDPLLDTLYLIAATDKEVAPSERRFLRRVGKQLGRDIDFHRIGRICGHLADGENLPDDFLHCRD